jgi:hypothetical protein
MNTWKVTSIEVLPAVTLHEVDVTSLIDSPVQQNQPALGVVSAEPQQNTLLGSGLEVTFLQLHRRVDDNLAAPDSEVVNTGLDSCQQLPRHLVRSSGLQTIVNVDCCQHCIRPELKVQATVHQHGSDKMVNALNHPLCMASLLMDVGGCELVHNLHGEEQI